MLFYKEYNANPKNRKTCDCVVRAISTASGLDYYDVYKRLFEISVKTGYMLNEKRVEDKLLEELGFVKYKQPKKANGTKYQLGELDKLVKPSDIVVVRVAHHLTAVRGYTLLDIWDARFKTINNYYILRK